MATDEAMETDQEIEIHPDTNKRLAQEAKDEGNQLYKLKKYPEALQKYSEAIRLCPECAPYYGNRAACYIMLGQPKDALRDANKATTIEPSFSKGWSRLAKCHVLLGDHISAKQALDKLETQAEKENELRGIETLEKFYNDGQSSLSNKDFRKALYCFDKAIEIATHSSNLKTLRAECLAYLGRYAEAQETANSVIQFDNMNAEAIFVRGLCLYYEDNVDKAFNHFTQVLRLAPDHHKAKEAFKRAKALKQKKEEGNTAFKAGKLDDAYNLYSEALNIDPLNRSTNAKLYFNRATVTSKQKNFTKSIEDCTKALELDSGYVKALLRRAKCYQETEQYEDAVRDYESVHKTDKTNREYRQLLQEAKIELKRSKRKDYYKVLGVGRNANQEEIKKAYRKRAMVHHPDRHSGATEDEKKEHEQKFKEVGEAFAVLSDEKKRRMYDNGQDLEDMGGGGGGHGGFHEMDPNHIFQAFFSGGPHGMGGGGGGSQFNFGGGGHGSNFHFQFS